MCFAMLTSTMLVQCPVLISCYCLLAQAEYAACVNKLEKDLVSNYQQQFETLFSAEAPTWETHGNLMVS